MGNIVENIQHISSGPLTWSKYDVVIVGSGPSGVMAARTFAEKGQAVLVLELGPVASPGAIHRDHQAPYSMAYGARGKLDTDPWTACCVGGGMQFYDAITFRYRAEDLTASRFLASDMEIDWPISISDLSEAYSEVESLLRVSGTSGHPEFQLSGRGRQLFASLEELGMQPKRIPLAIDAPGEASGCISCSACDERVCPIGAKASILSRSLFYDEGLSGSIDVRYGIFVSRVLSSREAHIDGVECFITFTADILNIPASKVILCANAIQSAAVFLRSSSIHIGQPTLFRSGLIGKGLSFKISGYSTGYVGDIPSDFDGPHAGPHATVFSDKFYSHADVPTGLGGMIYEANLPTPNENRKLLRLHYIAGEEPWSHNQIELTDSLDANGVPRLKISYTNSQNDLDRINFLAERSEDVLRSMGMINIHREPFQHGKATCSSPCSSRARSVVAVKAGRSSGGRSAIPAAPV
ncbi:NAD(P)/FAD-dependent oxidoreductase [Phaeobacter sp. B1627]|uniref:GMC family oxidoreductase N-terminal domain-containing protein n=1 Tax=Phaeobacter sp. B1627 TaxID=2583809 RepID=UPI00159EDAEB|nr:NAD(P)/FAD-dependent oxidoreductase [Phaeobacter sp. B1627]